MIGRLSLLLVSLGGFQYTIDKDKSAARNQHGWFRAARGKVWIRGLRRELRPMNKQEIKKISIGVEDFKTIIEKDGYFVDKTLMIQNLIKSNAMVTLFTRPRRFGKTLNQFMIRRFFEDERTEKGEKIDNGGLFDGLAITQCGEEILSHQQQYPVIFLTLKSAKQDTYALAYMELKKRLSAEYKRHKYVLMGDTLTTDEKERFEAVSRVADDDSLYTDALGFLSECLARYHGHNTFILIDEYDVPLENAYLHGFYDNMIGFIRSLFESALKTNPYLEKGIITGCLRISKESVFTGLNNLRSTACCARATQTALASQRMR